MDNTGDESTLPEGADVGAVAYGSLLAPEELDSWLSDAENRAVPVKVRGYRRVFNNEADWREASGKRCAVLNLVEDDERWFNGVLVPRLTRTEYEEYVERESGYTLEAVDEDAISYYGSDRQDIAEELLLAVGAQTSAGIEPIPSYLELCLDGADEWGAEFYGDFLDTTELQSGRTLAESPLRR